MDLDRAYLRKIAIDALEEDFGDGDITCDILIGRESSGSGSFIAKEDGVLAGFFMVGMIFEILDPELKVVQNLPEGAHFKKGDLIGGVYGDYSKMLAGERTALNFLQHTCGVATQTHKLVSLIGNRDTKLLDTRKTLPCLRALEKYAVRTAGGVNHRMGLYDMVLVKENHIHAIGGMKGTLRRIMDRMPRVPVEVEVTNFDELKTALKYPIDRIMLDNFTPDEILKAIEIRSEKDYKVPFEASGGINEENIADYAATGVEYISSGAITHSVKASDISLLFEVGEN
ncbi:MAG: carboxylating nicotinate-nucleotide diphosphorylase [Candidatus Zixiibacteriota bacterium]